ncbi:MAG: peptidoglycan editing factor PgeF [Candidatus Omnitrophica bacterium]|nr:peptidoglycan editing factor PgeF [Candidatus Omnitrophota bacterium]
MMPLHQAESSKTLSVFERIPDANIAAAYSNRAHGNMSLSHGDTGGSLTQRANFLRGLGIDHRRLVCARQVHGDRVYRVMGIEAGRGALDVESAIPACDALITDERAVPLAVFTADCLPIFLYDPITHSAGLVHAGWRSTAGRIAFKTVRRMQDEFGSRPARLHACFGPAIRQCCYEVSREFAEIFPGRTREENGKLFFDLVGANRSQLERAGLAPERIADSGICTACCPDEYFSYRKDGQACGRMMSVVMLR